MGKSAKLPDQRVIKMGDIAVIESCTFTGSPEGYKGSKFLTEHLLLYVLDGQYTAKHGAERAVVRPNEMVLLRKAIAIDYEKHMATENNYRFEAVLFFMSDEVIREFIKTSGFKNGVNALQDQALYKISATNKLKGFISSIKPYFEEPDNLSQGLIRIKMLELLYDVANADPLLVNQLLHLNSPARKDIIAIMEANYTNPVSLNDLAYMAGRSLSSFKRDFQQIYKISPAQWIRERRLKYAQHLLSTTDMDVSNVCYESGFESIAHFSRTFKVFFGVSPSGLKRKPVS
jgi:AraC family transcriptional regulator, exoenzyme S synthesis regulatory protein ExsA